MNQDSPKIVTIGGGTGSFTLLSGLKSLTPNLTAVIAMSDDGGSTGELRDEMGVLPPGDIRQALVALSRSSETMRELFNYRFSEGRLEGHSFGNLFITALQKVTDSFPEAVKGAEAVLDIVGHVLPVTLDDVRLKLTYSDGETVEGEHIIDEMIFKKGEKPNIDLTPIAKLNPEVKKAIMAADLVVIAPGTLHSSLIPNLIVEGMREALNETPAKVAYVCNLVTSAGQTEGYQVHDYAEQLERFGGEGMLDYVIYNTQKPTQEMLDNYAREGETWVEFDETTMSNANYEPIGGEFLSQHIHADDPKAARALIRHDSDLIAQALVDLVK